MAARPVGAAVEIAIAKFGGLLVPDDNTVSSVAGSQSILGGDPERVQWTLFNLSAATLYIGFGQAVSSINGFHVAPNGGYMSVNAVDDGDLSVYPVWMFSGAAGNDVFIHTLRREVKP